MINALQQTTPPVSKKPPVKITPMMAQFLDIKKSYQDCLLFYRMGDFYELFFEDAQKASKALDIALTKRGRHDGQDIPMCGVPVHSHESYLNKLIHKGFRVAICEQIETPEQAKQRAKKHGGHTLVQRDVVRIITNGTLTEDALLDATEHNFLAALSQTGQQFSLAWLDMSTGDFMVQPVERGQLTAVLSRLQASEILISEKLYQELFDVLKAYHPLLTPQPNSLFNSETAERRLKSFYHVETLQSFGDFHRAEISAAGALVEYLNLTQKGQMPKLLAPRRLQHNAILEIDSATRRNLELIRTLSGAKKGSLLSIIDQTVTGGGGRLLFSWLSMPLTCPDTINARLDMVQFFVEQRQTRQDLQDFLKHCPDSQRALSRLCLARGGPRDLAAIREALHTARNIKQILPETTIEGLCSAKSNLAKLPNLVERLESALAEDLPLHTRDGGFIASNYAPQLDRLRTLQKEGKGLILNLEQEYRKQTSISSLKIKYNNVLGRFIEVTAAHGDKLMTDNALFIHRQTLANCVRFTTVKLSELERDIADADQKAKAIEMALFEELVQDITNHAENIHLVGGALSTLDVTAALAALAVQNRYTRPILDHSLIFDIKNGRHPVIEHALTKNSESVFIANDCTLPPDNRLWLLTAPNMAGKSTFLRQNAIIAVMAQIGSYVPATTAHIGVIDRLFSRVGAADDLARGQSTFMVEMVETAIILNQATQKSLVILDEIGRGTATFDGLSLAWACIEHLYEKCQCRALFATHYHELNHLAEQLPALSCHTMRVKEWEGDVVFLHEISKGTADRSYGIHVAGLAGLPKTVIQRAEQVLSLLEKNDQSGVLAQNTNALPLFQQISAPSEPSQLEHLLQDIQPDELSPKEALEILYKLKGIDI